MNDSIQLYQKYFNEVRGGVYHIFTPYRFCPLGAHVDHQYGLVTGFAIDKGITLDYQPTKDGSVCLYSEGFPNSVELSLREDLPKKSGNWGDYFCASVYALKKKGYHLWKGIRGVVCGSMPIGGLSSSAAVILCYLQSLAQANDILLSQQEIIEAAYIAEREYVGVSVGTLDQSCEVYCRKDHLLFLDTKDQSAEIIPMAKDMPPFDIVIFYSGLSRRLGTGFNNRVDEMRAVSWYLKALEGYNLCPFNETHMRDVPEEVFRKHEKKLPELFRRRAEHFYGECARVREGARAWREGDLKKFGEQMFASGDSSINNYETGSPHLIALHEAAKDAPGVYGGRFCGAGFKGCSGVLVDPRHTQECIEYVTSKYLEQYPNLRGEFSAHVCHTADGLGTVLK